MSETVEITTLTRSISFVNKEERKRRDERLGINDKGGNLSHTVSRFHLENDHVSINFWWSIFGLFETFSEPF